MKHQLKLISVFSIACAAVVCGCGKKSKDSVSPSGGASQSGADFTLMGTLAVGNLTSLTSTTITHVMAVNPASSSPDRYISAVSNGSFSLPVKSGSPYTLVFIDNTKVGKEMVVGIFKDQTLDSVAPITANGSANLGAVGVDAATKEANPGTDYNTLLTSFGLSAAGAAYLGEIDDLSLRYANPDIDGNGVIDELENKKFGIDFHIRANTFKGTTGSTRLTVDDMTNQFLEPSGTNMADPRFNLNSAYTFFDSSFDSSTYTDSNGTLQSGVSFKYVQAGVENPVTNVSFSSNSWGSYAGFGPNYTVATGSDYKTPGTELPGSAGTPVDYVFGFNGKTLTFTNVVTLTKSQLEATNTLMVFMKFNTAGGGVGSAGQNQPISSISYKWMKRLADKSWTPATAEEIKLTVNDGGAAAAFYVNAKSNSAGFSIPALPEGEIVWDAANTWGKNDSATAAFMTGATPNNVCSMAISYDDKLGLRHFVGGVDANTGITQCN